MLKRVLRKFRPSPAMAVALLALIGAFGGAGWAANGGAFILGVFNNATQVTALGANYNGSALQIANASAAASATALTLLVGAGHPPMKVNATGKVTNLNVDYLDGLNSTAFGRVIAMRTTGASGPDLASGNNIAYAPAFTPSDTGRCVVTLSAELQDIHGAPDPTSRGPSLGIAVKRGAEDVVALGDTHRFLPVFSENFSTSITSTSVAYVAAGQPTQFGSYIRDPPSDWLGLVSHASITYFCINIGSLPSAQPAT